MYTCIYIRPVILNKISIITQVIIEILALSLAENGVIFCHKHLRRGEDKFSKLPPEEEINLMKKMPF